MRPLYNRVLLYAQDVVTMFRILLPAMSSQPDQAFHDTLAVVIDAMHYRHHVQRNSEILLGQFEDAIPDTVDPAIKTALLDTFEALLEMVYRSLVSYQLYDAEGRLQYYYQPHPDPTFEDIILRPIIALSYTPSGLSHAPLC